MSLSIQPPEILEYLLHQAQAIKASQEAIIAYLN